jgi:hypothetical protein
LHGERPGFFVGEPVDQELGVELSKHPCGCFEIGSRSADHRVRVGGQALGAVCCGGDSSDEQVIDMIAVGGLHDATDVKWSGPAHTSGVCATRSRDSSSRGERRGSAPQRLLEGGVLGDDGA